MKRMRGAFVLFAGLLVCSKGALAQGGFAGGGRRGDAAAPGAGPVQTIDQKTASLKKMDGFFPLYLDGKTGHLYLEISRFGTQFLYEMHTANGTGAGVNRGAVSRPYVVHFSRVGPKIFLTAENFTWRTTSADPNEQKAVKESFPESILAGFTVAAEDAPDHVLVDATDFVLRDAEDFASRMGAGYHLDLARSTIVPENTKSFPENDEIETMLTFTNEGGRAATAGGPGGFGGGERGGLAAVAPDEKNITVRARQSLIQLPPPGYKPRIWNPNSGFLLNTQFSDWSKTLGEPRETHYLTRHRLEKKDPKAAVSDPIKPITYYVDPGAPEPVRTALVEGARWWADAFKAAGFSNAFKVELLPAGADPYDVRYNVILWVEEESRGFSNGANIVDPRTGEIIKGEVTLTAGRERQDFLITDALLSPYKKSDKPDTQQIELVKQRIRQLSAHETGHTLGLGHNHAASSFSENGSVDDYPFPMITLDKDGKLDLSHAYPTGIGDWDKIGITYGYKEFAPGTTPEQEKAGLDKILSDAQKKGMYFITDSGTGSVSPHSSQWDNGANSAVELNRLLKVREVAMKNFSEAAIRSGEPMATLEDVLVPVYLLHRYQTEAAVQTIGGQDYRYALRGDGQMAAKMVAGAEQKAALDAVMKTLDPQMLTLPEVLLDKFPPRPPSYPRTQESFQGYAGVAFDPEAPVLAAADVTLDSLFDGARATRLVEFHARDASMPALADVIDQTLKATWYKPLEPGMVGLSQMTIDGAVLDHLVALSSSATASPVAKAVVKAQVMKLRGYITDQAKSADGAEAKAFYAAALESVGGGGRAGGAAAAGAAAAAPAGRGGRGAESATSIPAGAPIEPELTFGRDARVP